MVLLRYWMRETRLAAAVVVWSQQGNVVPVQS